MVALNIKVPQTQVLMEDQQHTESSSPRVFLFTSPGMGHLVPFCEFAQTITQKFQCQVTFITLSSFISNHNAMLYIQNLKDSGLPINFINLPPGADLPEENEAKNHSIARRLVLMMQKTVVKILQSQKHAPSAVVVDMFCTSLIPVVKDLGIPTYVFHICAASLLGMEFYGGPLVSQLSVPLKEVEFGIELPGLPPIVGSDFPDSLLDTCNDTFVDFTSHAPLLKCADGILINTFEDLEGRLLRAMTDQEQFPPLYAVGPLVSRSVRTSNATENDYLQWLNDQSSGSVILVSFGSREALSEEQIYELAVALENCGKRFLWVLGNSGSQKKLDEILPLGFIERNSEVGIVVSSWISQLDILCHPSVGCFVTHCGWNSIIEGIYCGVPMICWPVSADQFMMRAMLVKEFGVGIELKMEKDGFVRREEFERSVSEMFDGGGGRRAKERVKELQIKGKEAIECRGSSFCTMSRWVSSLGFQLGA